MRVELQPAYVLHTRPYRDTSLLVDIFSEDYGCLTLVAKGARQAKQRQRYLLQPFIPLLLSWQGNSQLKTLIGVEATASTVQLQHKFLYSALYVNELLSYLLPVGDAAPFIFERYEELLIKLRAQQDLEVVLRQFEFALLSELGYGIDFTVEALSGEPIVDGKNYFYSADSGFVLNVNMDGLMVFPGDHLLAIANNNFQNEAVRITAKKLVRMALHPHLGGKIIKSRELFR
jgi:DNA repair protein RecO (recombination protein O)